MTNEQLQWLLSLSVLSLVGPAFDMDVLESKGFYKKNRKDVTYFDRHIDESCKQFQIYRGVFDHFTDDLHVENQGKYMEKVNEFINNSEFSENVTKLMNVGRTMSLAQRIEEKPYIINGRLYFYEAFDLVMTYEHKWPALGLEAYDIANGVMLLRLGRYLGYIDEQQQTELLEKFYKKAEKYDYRGFGEAANIGREIHIKMMSEVLNTASAYDLPQALAASYHGIWKHMSDTAE